MHKLFDTVTELQQDVVRNIVTLLDSSLAFADLDEDFQTAADVADKAIARVMNTSDDFHYKAAIGYPFESDPFMTSRYSDGTFPIWYGSLDNLTGIYETVHHTIKREMAVEGFQNQKRILRHRMVYHVFCEGILIDLSAKKTAFPELVSDDYTLTQKIGNQLKQQGYPGILSPSSRRATGINANIFNKNLLSHPRPYSELIYELLPSIKKVRVSEENNLLVEISW